MTDASRMSLAAPDKRSFRRRQSVVNSRRSSILPLSRRGSATPGDEDDGYKPIEVVMKPKNQLQLSETELGETHVRVLHATDPNKPTAQVAFFTEQMDFKIVPPKDQLAVHFSMESNMIQADSEEARQQGDRQVRLDIHEAEVQMTRPSFAKNARASLAALNPRLSIAAVHSIMSASRSGSKSRSESLEPDESSGGGGKKTLVKNQFNFSERATQTFNNATRTKQICTEPPPLAGLNEQVSLDVIFDYYLECLERKVMAHFHDQKKKKNKGKGSGEGEYGNKTVQEITSPLEMPEFGRALKIMERIITNNSSAWEFNLYTQPLDDRIDARGGDGKGTFLPLWKFQFAEVKRKSATSLCWNPVYPDLFAVGHGSFDFAHSDTGMVCCYSLKNTSYPEYIIRTESGVTCLDFNRDHPALICLGMYDGTVAVYDLKTPSNPIFQSQSPETMHLGPVWQVAWGVESPVTGLHFFSVSSDGKVVDWALAKTHLEPLEEVLLKLETLPDDAEGMETLLSTAGGSCFDFSSRDPHLMLVGTEEGAIQAFSTQYNTEFVKSFEGHHMACYTVICSPFHPQVFLSCSADWTVRLWNTKSRNSIIAFDLDTAVGDVAWSPWSATVFAAVTTDGRVRIFDLSVSKYEPIGEFYMPKAKLTKVRFNYEQPILLVGDDKGNVLSLKLSSNMCRMSAPSREELNFETEVARLDLAMIQPEDKNAAFSDLSALVDSVQSGNTKVAAPEPSEESPTQG